MFNLGGRWLKKKFKERKFGWKLRLEIGSCKFDDENGFWRWFWAQGMVGNDFCDQFGAKVNKDDEF